MARNALISEARLRLIEKRQMQQRWGSDYRPAMCATRDEAPTRSRPSRMYSTKLARELHFMSLPERHVCLLALYHPKMFDIHEQHMLHPFGEPHPLAGRPDTQHLTLLPYKGTVDVAHRFKALSKHPVIWIDNGQGEPSRLPFPYLGDFLVFLTDEQGPYCVNWSVKARYEDFLDLKHLSSRTKTKKFDYTDGQALALRHRIEKEYFSDAGIPTHFISAENLDTHVIANLQALYTRAHQPTSLSADNRQAFECRIRDIIGTPQTVLSVLPDFIAETGCTRQDCLVALYQAIWYRRLRVNLHAPILPDKPLRAEHADVLKHYAHLFAR